MSLSSLSSQPDLDNGPPFELHTFDNGLTLIAQPMPWLKSASFSVVVPAGHRFDPPDRNGLANLVSEMVQRGCGSLTSREFLESMEALGTELNSSVTNYHTCFGCDLVGEFLFEALSITAELLRRAHLPAEQLEDAQTICVLEIQSLEDDLGQKVITELSKRFLGAPDGNNREGKIEDLMAITPTDVQQFYSQNYRPNGSILACAGNLDWQQLKDHVGAILGDWQPQAEAEVKLQPPQHGSWHIPFESEQTHIGVAYPAVPVSHPDQILCMGAVRALSGGLSSRLFTEIREKRGLCYTVDASYSSLIDRGLVAAYAGTSTERAQETLDILLEQLTKLYQGIDEAELRRVKIQVKTALISQQESARARSSRLASDWFYLGRLRTLEEVATEIERLNVDTINRYLLDNPPLFFDIVTLGSQPLATQHHGISTTSID